jgi:DNA-binding SARP family transcriptional activator
MDLIGELAVRQGGEAIALPRSRKCRALIAYLAATARPQRREHLCELLWEVPDDPRGSLRWSLSKIAGAGNALIADSGPSIDCWQRPSMPPSCSAWRT